MAPILPDACEKLYFRKTALLMDKVQEFGKTWQMGSGVRRFALTVHVVVSVGWMGAVSAFLALAVAGLASRDIRQVTGAYLAMDLIGWYVIVPLCAASMISGLVQALGTPWGLFKHYWVLLKFVITIAATILLLIHMQIATRVANAGTLLAGDLRGLRLQLVTDAGGALAALLINTTLSVYKPKGMTAYGRRKYFQERGELIAESNTAIPRWLYALGITLLVALFVIRHLGGHGGH